MSLAFSEILKRQRLGKFTAKKKKEKKEFLRPWTGGHECQWPFQKFLKVGIVL